MAHLQVGQEPHLKVRTGACSAASAASQCLFKLFAECPSSSRPVCEKRFSKRSALSNRDSGAGLLLSELLPADPAQRWCHFFMSLVLGLSLSCSGDIAQSMPYTSCQCFNICEEGTFSASSFGGLQQNCFSALLVEVKSKI